ncbi:MAG: serine hydrolase [Minicystis sp.]
MRAWRRALVISAVTFGTGCAPAATGVVAAPPPAAAPIVPSVDPSGEWEVRWDRTFTGWKPSLFEGTLSLQREGEAWRGKLAFRQSVVKPAFESLRIEGDHVDIVFRAQADKKEEGPLDIVLSGWIREGRLIGEMRWGNTIGWSPIGGRRFVLPRLVGKSVDAGLPAVDLAASGVDRAALDALLDHARTERSSAIVILKDGKVGTEVYREDYDGSPLVAMSASKSIVSLAVGMLVAEKKLDLDTRMDALFPEWKGLGPKGALTVRHLLTHTSGLDPTRAKFQTETIREHVLQSKLVYPPGARFQYNNNAVDFLAVVVGKVAGVPLDAYLETRLFQKVGIKGAFWKKDKEGTPLGAGELFIRPVDLAKLGQLMLDGGTWRGERILPAAWVDRTVAAGQSFQEDCGLLWWREGTFARALTEPVLGAWRDLGVDEAALQNARALLGKKYAERSEYAAAVAKTLGPAAFEKLDAALKHGDHLPFSASVSDGPVRGFSARGWLGQTLVVLPQTRVVAVRMRAPEKDDYEKDGGDKEDRNTYPAFSSDVARLFPVRE